MRAHTLYLVEEQTSYVQAKPGTRSHKSFLKGAHAGKEHEVYFIYPHRGDISRPEIQVQTLDMGPSKITVQN